MKALIGRQDLVIVKNFFGQQAISDERTEKYVQPGVVSFEAMSAYEPKHEAQRLKGIRVNVSAAYVPDAYRSRTEHVSVLVRARPAIWNLRSAIYSLSKRNGQGLRLHITLR